ncbi:hypothetical protein FRC07_002106 [Ceratobasidium sp. 392]|nr:hypothetical protein FRC07_002106 [Ceratobasidium sp. 392]
MRVFFAIALAAATILGASAAPGLSVSITAPSSVTNIENLSIDAIVKNTGTETLMLLKDPRSVLTSAGTRVFKVAGKRGSPRFTGRFIKYSPDYVIKRNNAADFVVLAPGQVFKLTHKLAGLYNFTHTGAGEFQFEPFNVFSYIDSAGKLSTINATTQSAKIHVSVNLALNKSTNVIGARSHSIRRVSYVGCSLASRNHIEAAVRGANAYITTANGYLSELSGGTPRYTTWFGSYDPDRAATVRNHFSLMESTTPIMSFDCMSCNIDTYYAFVFPDQPGRIYLCPLFWLAPVTGTNSRAGTIVHELSHFDVNGNTQDYVYGKQASMQLAVEDPGQAIMNADNRQFFAENHNPTLP